jgi:hypothetical protein
MWIRASVRRRRRGGGEDLVGKQLSQPLGGAPAEPCGDYTAGFVAPDAPMKRLMAQLPSPSASRMMPA